MKRGLIPIIVIALVLLCACGGGNENPGSAPESGESVQSAQNGEESKTGTQESSAETSAYEQSENGGTENPKPGESEGQQTEPLPLVGGPADRTGRRILISEGCKYTAFGTRHEQYGDDGRRLTDGVLGGEVGWGWQTSNGRFVLDLGSVVEGLADFNMYLRGDAWGIVPPTKAEYYVSADGKKWELAGSVSGEEVVATPADGDWVEYSFPLAPYNTCNARYVR
ncbi:MAG: hypothetical protein J5925_05745, partial [Clostridia bacterium]|nr:hypothetical protein [Clostridia bacterium]